MFKLKLWIITPILLPYQPRSRRHYFCWICIIPWQHLSWFWSLWKEMTSPRAWRTCPGVWLRAALATSLFSVIILHLIPTDTHPVLHTIPKKMVCSTSWLHVCWFSSPFSSKLPEWDRASFPPLLLFPLSTVVSCPDQGGSVGAYNSS